MKKTLIFLVVIFSLLLAACNQPTEAPPTPTEAVAAPTEAQPAAATAEPTQPSEAAATEPAATEPSAPAPAQPAPEVAKTLRLPDLEGRTVVAVTGNDYTPLNFVDPASGKSVGWEYDAVNEICRRLNCVVDWQVTAWDTMISAVQEGQFDVGMDGITINDERKQQVDFSAQLFNFPDVHAGSR